MDNKFSRKFQVMEPKDSSEYKIRIYSDEYEKYIDESKESFVGAELYFVAKVSRIGSEYFNVDAYFEGELFTRCSRCRDNALVDLSGKFKRAYKYSEYETKEEEDLIYYNTIHIDLFDFFVDEISLIIPSYIRCKEDCKGLCLTCGENLNKNSCNHS